MVNTIEDFSAFSKQMKEMNVHEVMFTINKEDFSLKYSEMTSEEDVRNSKEFEKWFKQAYEVKDDAKKDFMLHSAMDGQWRVWKMLRPHMKNLETFEDFLRLPTAVTSCIVRAIEENLTVRYPHLKRA